MKESFSMTKQMEKEITITKVDLSIKEIGRMTSKMDLEERNGKMVLSMKECLQMD